MLAQRRHDPPLEPVGHNAGIPTAAQREENVFTVLRDQARSRSRGGLWTTAVGGALNAALVWWQSPALSWLAAGFLSAAAYGSWGLLDRFLAERDDRPNAGGLTGDALPEMRTLIVLLGTAAAAWAVVGFSAAALGGGARH
jgi:hypothetical protein